MPTPKAAYRAVVLEPSSPSEPAAAALCVGAAVSKGFALEVGEALAEGVSDGLSEGLAVLLSGISEKGSCFWVPSSEVKVNSMVTAAEGLVQ